MPEKNKPKIKITKNGPCLVSGNLPLQKEIIRADENGTPLRWEKGERYPEQENYALCRCGASKNKPYCDGSHLGINFDGTETASHKKFDECVEKIEGPEIILKDQKELCALARFCDRGKGVWDLTESSDNPEDKETAIQEACDCPSGRLVMMDKKTGKNIEPQFDPSISLIEDPASGTSGAIWAKGGIAIESAEGEEYEIRNRVTLCRCGKSMNKPFCDGRHVACKFNDGDKSLK